MLSLCMALCIFVKPLKYVYNNCITCNSAYIKFVECYFKEFAPTPMFVLGLLAQLQVYNE